MDAIDRYINYISSVRRYSARTCTIYRDVLEHFAEFASPGDEDFSDVLNVNSIRAYEVSLMDNEKMSSRTVAQHLSVLSGFCRYLMKDGSLASNPVRLVSRPKQEKRLPEFYRGSSMDSYLEETRGTAEFGSYDSMLSRLIISILYSTGIRRSELISLDVASVDFSRRTVRVRGKGDKVREIPLLESLCAEIKTYLDAADALFADAFDSGSPLLRTRRGGRLYPVFIDRAVKKELSGVEGISGRRSPHVLRHTLATGLLDSGADIYSIKEMLGHSSLAATQVYTHNSIEKLQSAYEAAHPRAKKQ